MRQLISCHSVLPNMPCHIIIFPTSIALVYVMRPRGLLHVQVLLAHFYIPYHKSPGLPRESTTYIYYALHNNPLTGVFQGCWIIISSLATTMSHSPNKFNMALFGSQPLELNRESLHRLYKQLNGLSSDARWIFDVLAELPQYWQAVQDQIIEKDDDVPGAPWLAKLPEWLQMGHIPDDVLPLPNVLLTPLVVVMQLVEFERLWKHGKLDLEATPPVGLCIGLLSALAVSCASSTTTLHLYGAVAIRLAMIVGATVDAQDSRESGLHGCAKSLCVSWNPDIRQEAIEKLVTDVEQVSDRIWRHFPIKRVDIL
jgi:hypothetical protein